MFVSDHDDDDDIVDVGSAAAGGGGDEKYVIPTIPQIIKMTPPKAWTREWTCS